MLTALPHKLNNVGAAMELAGQGSDLTFVDIVHPRLVIEITSLDIHLSYKYMDSAFDGVWIKHDLPDRYHNITGSFLISPLVFIGIACLSPIRKRN